MFFILLTASIERAGARKRRRLSLLLSVGWLLPSLCPSGAGLARGTRVCVSLCTPARVTPHRGGVSADAQAKPRDNGWRLLNGRALCRQRDLLGYGPQKSPQFPRAGDHTLVGLFPSGASLSGALASSSLRLPTGSLARLGPLLQASLQMPADFGGVAIGPGAFDQGPAGMAVARLRDAALAAPLSRRGG